MAKGWLDGVLRALGSLNLTVGLVSCLVATVLVLGLVEWPFAGPKPTQTEVLLTHFGLATAGFVVLWLQLQAIRNPDPEGQVDQPPAAAFFLIRTVAAAFAGMIQIGIVFWAWENGFQERDWAIWLLLPGITGTLAWFWVIDGSREDPQSEPDSEHIDPPRASDYARADIEAAENFSFLRVVKAGLVYGALFAAVFGSFPVFTAYREVMAQVFFKDRFIGWGAVLQLFVDVLSAVWPIYAGMAAVLAVLVVGENVLRRLVTSGWRDGDDHGSSELREDQAELIDATLENIEDDLRLDMPRVLKWTIGIALFVVLISCATALAMLSLAPIFLALWVGSGIGAQLFEAQRTQGLDPVLYFDSVGGFEAGLSLALGCIIFCGSFWLSRLVPALTIWSWRFTDEEQRRLQLIRSISEAVRRGEVNQPSDFSLERASMLMSQRFEKGSLILAAVFAAGAVLLWPLDRMHYAFLSDEEVAGGRYYLPGSVQRFGVDEIPSIKRRCRKGDDGPVIRWDAQLPNGGEIGVTQEWKSSDAEQQAMLLRVMKAMLASDASLDDRIDEDRCRSYLDDRFGKDAELLAPLFGLRSGEASES